MKNGGVWVGILLFLFGLVIFTQSFSYEYFSDVGPGPGFFPLWLSVILMVLSLIYIFVSFRKEKIFFSEMFPKKKSERAKIAEILLSVVLFIVLAPNTGFNIAGTVMLFILLIRSFRWHLALGISVIVTLAVFVLFQQLLEIPLPVNSFGW